MAHVRLPGPRCCQGCVWTYSPPKRIWEVFSAGPRATLVPGCWSSLILAGCSWTRFHRQANHGPSANESLMRYPFLIHQTLLFTEKACRLEGSFRCEGWGEMNSSVSVPALLGEAQIDTPVTTELFSGSKHCMLSNFCGLCTWELQCLSTSSCWFLQSEILLHAGRNKLLGLSLAFCHHAKSDIHNSRKYKSLGNAV